MEVRIFKEDTIQLISGARHVGNNALTLLQFGCEQVSKKEVADMVCGELALDTVLGFREVPRGHDSSVIDETMNFAGDFLDVRRGLSNRRVVQEVCVDEPSVDAWIYSFNILDYRLDFALRSPSQDEALRIPVGEPTSQFSANASLTRPCDDV